MKKNYFFIGLLLTLVNINASYNPCDNGKHHSYACQQYVFDGHSHQLPLISPYHTNLVLHKFFGTWKVSLRAYPNGASYFGNNIRASKLTLYKNQNDGHAYGKLITSNYSEARVDKPDDWSIVLRFYNSYQYSGKTYQCRYFKRADKYHKLCRVWVNNHFDGYIGYTK